MRPLVFASQLTPQLPSCIHRASQVSQTQPDGTTSSAPIICAPALLSPKEKSILILTHCKPFSESALPGSSELMPSITPQALCGVILPVASEPAWSPLVAPKASLIYSLGELEKPVKGLSLSPFMEESLVTWAPVPPHLRILQAATPWHLGSIDSGHPHQQIASEGVQEATMYQQRATFSPATCFLLYLLGNTQSGGPQGCQGSLVGQDGCR